MTARAAAETILVIPSGSSVFLGDIPAKVLSVSIRGSAVQYEVAWIVGGDRKTAWCDPHEIRSDADMRAVGFVTPSGAGYQEHQP